MVNHNNLIPVVLGQLYLIEAPYSEVCISMRVAGKQMFAELVLIDGCYAMVQLYSLDGQVFSAEITTGEAGFYGNSLDGYYFYPPANTELAIPRHCSLCQTQTAQLIPLGFASACPGCVHELLNYFTPYV